MLIQNNSNPKNTVPQRNPIVTASKPRSTWRSAQNRGIGATNASGPRSNGGNAAHINKALANAAR